MPSSQILIQLGALAAVLATICYALILLYERTVLRRSVRRVLLVLERESPGSTPENFLRSSLSGSWDSIIEFLAARSADLDSKSAERLTRLARSYERTRVVRRFLEALLLIFAWFPPTMTAILSQVVALALKLKPYLPWITPT